MGIGGKAVETWRAEELARVEKAASNRAVPR